MCVCLMVIYPYCLVLSKHKIVFNDFKVLTLASRLVAFFNTRQISVPMNWLTYCALQYHFEPCHWYQTCTKVVKTFNYYHYFGENQTQKFCIKMQLVTDACLIPKPWYHRTALLVLKLRQL